MRVEEKNKLLESVRKKVLKFGIPMNVRQGGNEEAADWVDKIVSGSIMIDEPLGVIPGSDYERCPKCNHTIGQSAYFCKHCGAYLRMVVDS